MTTNPYEFPQHVEESAPPQPVAGSRTARLFWLCGILAPLLSLVPAYCCWILAGATLGHVPRPSIDDPMQINPLISRTTAFSYLAITLFPVWHLIAAVAILGSPYSRDRNGKIRMPRLFEIGIAVYGLWFSLLRFDPGDVFVWLWD